MKTQDNTPYQEAIFKVWETYSKATAPALEAYNLAFDIANEVYAKTLNMALDTRESALKKAQESFASSIAHALKIRIETLTKIKEIYGDQNENSSDSTLQEGTNTK